MIRFLNYVLTLLHTTNGAAVDHKMVKNSVEKGQKARIFF
jgi:hypothetical protein